MEIKISSFSDETGQDTKWKNFYVCTVVCLSTDQSFLEDKLIQIEKKSGKTNKWYKSNNKRRKKYIDLIQYEKIFRNCCIYYSQYQNKSEYVDLVSSHIVKSIKSYCKKSEPEAKIFVDKVDTKTTNRIKKEIKLYKIKYKKIRGLTDESNSIIRLADAVCGLIRDLKNPKAPLCYKKLFLLIQEV